MRMRGMWPALGLALVTALSGCQATTHLAASAGPAVYPDKAGSPGITDATLTIAVAGVTNQDSTLRASYGPVFAALQKVVEQVNAEGGVTGRKLTMVPMFDAVKGDEKSVADATRVICDLAVRRERSFLMQGQPSFGSVKELEQAGCVAGTRTVNVLRTGLIKADELTKSPDVVAPYALDDVTAARTLVRRLAAEKFFDGATKVGVLNPGGGYAATINDVLVKELAVLGIKDPFVLIGKGGAETQADASSNVLKLKMAKVDRIVYLNDSQGGLLLQRAMVGQKFTPPLGTLNNVYPEDLITYAKYPAHNVYVVSTLAGFSTSDNNGELLGLPKTQASSRCLGAINKTGQKLAPGTSFPLLAACDVLGLTVEALRAGGAKEPSTAAFFTGLSKLPKFDSAFGIPLDFSHGRAGASQVWSLKGDDSCSCLKTTGGPYPVARG
ncbi:ABC transporter substrate-binding protein [Nonomuraea angiospora]|uniref:Leucine-binding protein domain-containing protein n=1 Tax=Nonomuraea angiospora TaxID=46172 RepID=A0ABR9LQ42_9ACTN|nr:ABC transporter substrate-binding protein [Nonomuraea angiospora]MBE1582768.1 hypothetical protein [Nonomuraea angiospora]